MGRRFQCQNPVNGVSVPESSINNNKKYTAIVDSASVVVGEGTVTKRRRV